MLSINEKNLCASCFSGLEKDSVVCNKCGYRDNEENPRPLVLPIGTILLGKYVIGKVLGKGGFGVTYLAYDINKKEKVAIKEYMPDSLAYRAPGTSLITTYQGEKEEAFKLGAEKFYEEAKTISRFNGHPNIVNVREFFYENNTAYFVMEYIEGINLKEYTAQRGGRLNEQEMLQIALPLMNALIIVHSVDVLHRDISPDNIYIANDGTVKLLDFGAARQVLGEQSKSLSVILKPGFAPIEQYQTRGKQGPWTDIYGLAATMYYCMTGHIPEAAMDRVEEDKLESLSGQGAAVSQKFEKALLKSLSLRAINRYQSMIEFKTELKDVLQSSSGSPNNLGTNGIENQDHPVNGLSPVNPYINPYNQSLQQPGQGVQNSIKKKFSPIKIAVITTSAVMVAVLIFCTAYYIYLNAAKSSGDDQETAAILKENANTANNIAIATADPTAKTAPSPTVQATPRPTVKATPTPKAKATPTPKAKATPTPKVKAILSPKVIATPTPTVKATPTPTIKATPTTVIENEYSKKVYSNGDIYEGYIVDGQRNGYGTMTYNNGDKYEGNWLNDEKSGQGTFVRSDGTKYVGNWQYDKFSGYGIMTWTKGDKYEGNFVNGFRNGYGRYTWPNGDIYEGNWVDGERTGQGTYTWVSGEKHIGNWLNGLPNGQGKETDKYGNVIREGTWSNGKFVG